MRRISVSGYGFSTGDIVGCGVAIFEVLGFYEDDAEIFVEPVPGTLCEFLRGELVENRAVTINFLARNVYKVYPEMLKQYLKMKLV